MADALNILILEDQGLVRAGMRELIQISEPHARIVEAAGFDEAVARIEAGPIDIAFLDVDLKGDKTGLDFTLEATTIYQIASGVRASNMAVETTVNLSGTSQYVALPAGILNGATVFTVAMWVRLDTITNWQRVFDLYEPAS